MTSALDREAAPFDERVWDLLDEVARHALEEASVARRLLLAAGPLGLDARAGVGEDEPAGEEDAGPAGGGRAVDPHLHVPRARVLPLFHAPFRIGMRAIEAFLARGEPLDTRAVADAARVVAGAQDRLVFGGSGRAGIRGLLESHGAIELPAGEWDAPQRAADDLLAALAALDDAGRHGPFAAAVPPLRWYALFRPYPGSPLTPYAQLSPLFEGGIHKAPALGNTAVVLARDAAGPRLLVGQPLAAAYDGREGVFHRFSLLESVTLMPGVEGSVALLQRHGSAFAHPSQPAPDELS